jgi:acyl transferase domain-containing protein
MVLALRHALLPRTLHADEPSPHVDWSAGAVRLLTEAVPWTAGERPRRAGVSSFGMSGTNVHLILEEPPAAECDGQAAVAPLVGGATAWVMSGRTADGVRAQAGRLAAHLAAHPGLAPADVAWSLAATRSAFEHRAVLIGTSRDELVTGLPGLTADAAAGDPGRVVFVFPGQGAQWAGMGRELAATSPVFAARLAECARALAPHVGWDLQDVIESAEALESAEVTQPVLWAVMVSLARVRSPPRRWPGS